MRGSSPRMIVPNPVAPKKKKRQHEQGDATCPDVAAKIFRFSAPPNHRHIYRRLVSSRGAARDRHGRWERDAVDATGASDEGAWSRSVKSCGPDAQTLASSWRKNLPLAMVANKPGHQGEREGTR